MVIKPDTILEGRVSYDELPSLTKEVFHRSTFKASEGVTKKGRKYIKYSDIYWGEVENNPIRVNGSTKRSISNLATSRKQGIDVEAPRPIVEKRDVTSVTGDVYHYCAENGITRKKADFMNNQQDGGDWYDVVTYQDTEGRTAAYNREVFLQLQNDDLPQEVHSDEDLEASVSRLIAAGALKKEEYAIKTFVDESAPNLSTRTRNEVVRRSINNNGVPTKTITWRDNECKEWYSDKCIETDDVEVDYFFATHYFQDRIYPLLKQYADSGKVQTISEHITKIKGDNIENLHKLRGDSKDTWDEAERVFGEVAKYMLLHEFKLPVQRGLWQPQVTDGDDKEDPNRFVRLPTE